MPHCRVTSSPRYRRLLVCILLQLAASWFPALGSTEQDPVETPVDLPFEAFFARPIGPRGLEPSQRLQAANGHCVRLQGYMVAREQATPGSFLLTSRPTRLSEHADGDADDLPPATVSVQLHPSQRARIVTAQAGLLALTGRFQLGRAEDADGRVSWFRLLLEPDALAASSNTP
jgi:hypothetical protein